MRRRQAVRSPLAPQPYSAYPDNINWGGLRSGDSTMAKKARKRVAAKARKPAKSAAKKAAKSKRAVAKPRRKAAPAKAAKPVAKKPPAAKPVASKPVAAQPAASQPAADQQTKQPRRNFVQRIEHKVEDAVEAVFDTLTDAERLHRKLEPDITPDQE
jgi:predicted lipid-binding transport protein (Tim44 family)